MTRRSSVLELLQGDVGDDQTGVSIAFTVALVVLVICPRASGALSEDEPVFIVICTSHPVQPDLLVACHIVSVLSPPRRI
jgi:hypothetical protein